MRPLFWAALIISNLFWSANPLMAKHLLLAFSPWQVAWIRYTSAGLGLLIAAPFLISRGQKLWFKPKRTPDSALLFFLGFLPFCVGPIVNLVGLNASQASESALMVAVEPLAAALLAWIFLGEKLSLSFRIAWLIATAGFLLLSGGTSAFASGGAGHLEANLFLLCAQLCEGAYSVIGKRLSGRYPATGIFAMAWLAGWLCLTLAVAIHTPVFGSDLMQVLNLEHWTLGRVSAALWLGAIGSTGGYLLWMIVLEQASVAMVAMTLFIQPVGGAVLGILVLQETLSPLQWIGTVLILGASALPLLKR